MGSVAILSFLFRQQQSLRLSVRAAGSNNMSSSQIILARFGDLNWSANLFKVLYGKRDTKAHRLKKLQPSDQLKKSV